jgi:L,D-transpeptidase YcbB
MIRFVFFALLLLVSVWRQPVAGQPVPSYQYQLLSQAHADYLRIAASQHWLVLPGDICLRPGQTDLHILKLRNNLLLTGDLQSLGPGTAFAFDDSLQVAVKRFQQRHGLQADGIVGVKTLAALNVSPEERVQQIELNLERWQQIPYDAYPLVLVNIADFSLQLLDNAEQVVWQTKVIVGQTPKVYQTAVTAGSIRYLVLNPTWNVPKSIIRNEIIPMLRRDAGYLARNHMLLYRLEGSRRIPVPVHAINWQRADVDRDKLMVIQQAGPENALGTMKFIFPNPHDQYLHDTPYKSLFSHPVRTYSHGCVRVQQPEVLAGFLLSTDWEFPVKPARLPRSRQVDKIISLPAPVNIRMGYFTAWVNEKGILQFRPDIYQLDKKSKKPQPRQLSPAEPILFRIGPHPPAGKGSFVCPPGPGAYG